MFIYYRRNGEVAMRSDNRCDAPSLTELEVNDAAQIDLIKQGYIAKVDKAGLHLEKSPKLIRQELQEKKSEAIERLKQMKVDQELKDIIMTLTQ